jgi:hypothetical protein
VVLLALADHANEHGLCWPSISILVRRANVGERTVQRALQSLESAGFVTRERRLRENGSDTSNLYRLIFDRTPTDTYGNVRTPTDHLGGAKLTPHPITLQKGINTLSESVTQTGGDISVGGDAQTGGEGVTGTGGEGGLHDTPRTVIKNHHIEPSNISVDSEFEEFWSIYPRRPNNPRKKAMAAYIRARKNVSQKQLLEAIGLYAAYMAGENPKFIAMASTWLNEERWNCDYSKGAEVIKSYDQAKYGGVFGAELVVSDDDVNGLIRVFPGHVGERDRAKRLLAAEMAKGVQIDQICRAAEKYSLFCKGPPYEDRRITPSMLEPWLQFKWREMEAYEVCYVGADRIKTVRPIKGKS